jgi:release factor glutamine methyltransferase
MSRAEGVSWLEAMSIVSLTLSIRKEQVLTSLDAELEEEALFRIESLLKEREQGRPLAYIRKEKEFFSERFYVDERVLIPRPETEVLVEEALGILRENPRMSDVVDMGTGSGAIAVVVAKESRRSVLCVDVSADALRVARKNGLAPVVRGSLRFVCSDLFGGVGEGKRFDIVLANLPYIPSDSWEGLADDVKRYEPRLALDGGQRGTEVYRRLVAQLQDHMKPGGRVLLEIDGARQAAEVGGMLRVAGFDVAIRKDYSERERVLIGSWTSLS